MDNDFKLSNFDYTDFIGVPLDTEEQNILSELLDCKDPNGRTIKFRGLVSLLSDYYIETKYKKIRINNKQKRVVYLIDTYK
ncbi:MAG: hypothetical protein ACRC6T_05330 [Sarcina sp.]